MSIDIRQDEALVSFEDWQETCGNFAQYLTAAVHMIDNGAVT
jgi:hypothetical protein